MKKAFSLTSLMLIASFACAQTALPTGTAVKMKLDMLAAESPAAPNLRVDVTVRSESTLRQRSNKVYDLD